MLMQRRRNNIFEDLFGTGFWDGFEENTQLMKTDVKENGNEYELSMDLPGYEKEDIHAELKDGYLTIHAQHNNEKEEKDDKGNYIFRERTTGSCRRSFYVGADVTQEQIKAEYKNGTLHLIVPKVEHKQVEDQTHYISIA